MLGGSGIISEAEGLLLDPDLFPSNLSALSMARTSDERKPECDERLLEDEGLVEDVGLVEDEPGPVYVEPLPEGLRLYPSISEGYSNSWKLLLVGPYSVGGASFGYIY